MKKLGGVEYDISFNPTSLEKSLIRSTFTGILYVFLLGKTSRIAPTRGLVHLKYYKLHNND